MKIRVLAVLFLTLLSGCAANIATVQPSYTMVPERRLAVLAFSDHPGYDRSGALPPATAFDPAALFAPPEELRRNADLVLQEGRAAPGHIFNLGHGIWPETSPDAVARLVDHVHASTRK